MALETRSCQLHMDPLVSIDAKEISRRIRRQTNSQDKGQKCIFLSCSFMCSMSNE